MVLSTHRNSGGRRGCDTTFQDEEKSSPLECRKHDVCWRLQEQANAPVIDISEATGPGRGLPPKEKSAFRLLCFRPSAAFDSTGPSAATRAFASRLPKRILVAIRGNQAPRNAGFFYQAALIAASVRSHLSRQRHCTRSSTVRSVSNTATDLA